MPARAGVPDRIILPVVGNVFYEDDFGDPRGNGTHQGNDILADRHAPVVAVEAGKVRIWTSSESAGCMLYLYGRSGATYLYIHLNNDHGKGNDNRGTCKPGIAYAPGLRDGQSVRAGQLVGYVGDSGDADGLHPHLHFEVHPGGGAAVSPFHWLRRAERLLFAVPEQELDRETEKAATLTLVGTVVRVDPGAGGDPPADTPPQAGDAGSGPPPPPPPPDRSSQAGDLLTVRITIVSLSTGGSWRVGRSVTLVVAAATVVERASGKKAGVKSLEPGAKVAVTTAPVVLSLDTQRARPGALVAARIALRA